MKTRGGEHVALDASRRALFAVSEAGGRILIAEDDECFAAALARQLKSSGFEVETALNGKTAIAELWKRDFEMVLSDIGMPEMNGIELLRAVRAHDPDIPVVMMTGAPELASAVSAIEHGALRYLVKPFAHSKLLTVVESAVQLCRMARLKRQAILLVGDPQRYLEDRVDLDLDFTRGLEGIWMALQPIVCWSKREVYAYEMLLRTSEPHFKNPGELLSAAEQSGRLVDLGRTIRRIVAATAERMGDALLFINLHTRDLNDEDLFSKDAPLSKFAERIVLEVTERASLDEILDVELRMERLRAMGFRIALDDLGAGYAGLSSLAQLRPEIVKLDMSLIRGLDIDSGRQKLVRAMIKLAREMGKLVVIEGVETIGERDALVQLGADLFQGYLFAMPGRSIPVVTW